MGAVPVVVVGDTLAELVVPVTEAGSPTEDPRALVVRPHGAAARTAVWLASLGIPTTLVGRIGEDALGRAIAADLARRRVDVVLRAVPGAPTGTVVTLTSPYGEAARVDEPGAAAMLSPDDLPADTFVAGTHLHLAGRALVDPSGSGVGAAAIRLARTAGMTVSAEPPPVPVLQALDPATARTALSGVDLLVTGVAEAFALVEDVLEQEGGDLRPERYAAALARSVAAVVVTGGPAGAWWHGRRSAPAHVMVHGDADRGTGDVSLDPFTDDGTRDDVRPAFVAGLLAAWLLDARPVQALRSGCTIATRARGGPDPLPDEGGGARVRT
ncbi:MAG TPA: PfkB family carbohydrate kinase [Actinomycetes bacterium]|nr:PfkB family carbohydrate kinase [Actinomycetes bacterium]